MVNEFKAEELMPGRALSAHLVIGLPIQFCSPVEVEVTLRLEEPHPHGLCRASASAHAALAAYKWVRMRH